MARRRERPKTWSVGGVFDFAVLLILIALALWVWTRPTKQQADSRSASVANKAQVLPGASAAPATIRIASWNILNLGKNTPVAERAEIIAQFDLVALQEVESLEGLERLHKKVEEVSGVPWGRVVSPKVGEDNAAEHYVFLYRADRVKEVVEGQRGVFPETSPSDFSREPFFATFKAGNFDFTLITIVPWTPPLSAASAFVAKNSRATHSDC